MKDKRFLFPFIILIFCSGCAYEDSSPTNLKKIDLASAQVLFLGEQDSFMEPSGKLYIINKDKVVRLASITTSSGRDFYSYNSIAGVLNINDLWMAVMLEKGDDRSYIVNKTTGDAFSIKEHGEFRVPGALKHGHHESELITADKHECIYFLNDKTQQIVRLNIADINNFTSELASYKDDEVLSFSSDANGNIGYEGFYNGERILRAVSASGTEMRQIPEHADMSHNYIFQGCNGKLYSDDTELLEISFMPISFSKYTDKNNNSGCGYSLVWVTNKQTDVAIEGCTNGIKCFNHKDTEFVNVELKNIGIGKISQSKANSNFYFLCHATLNGAFAISKIDPETTQPEELINSNIEIQDFDVLETNELFYSTYTSGGQKSEIHYVSESLEHSIIGEVEEKVTIFLAISNLQQ